MFDFLKKKISSFVDSVVKKAAGPADPKPEEKLVEPMPETLQENKSLAAVEEPHSKKVVEAQVEKIFVEEKKLFEKIEEKPVEAHQPRGKLAEQLSEKIVENPAEKILFTQHEKKGVLERKPEIELKPKLGIVSRIKSVFSPEITIDEGELAPVLEQLETALLESDVSFDATQEFVKQLRTRLAGKRVKSGAVEEEVKSEVKNSLMALFPEKHFDLFDYASAMKQKNEVAVVLFVGPNGSGKTTTVAKLAKQLNDRGVSSVIAAGDTFRKAAIEQARVHGERLGVRVVSHQYGADPTAVAFDAIQHARTSGKTIVLVDTAGRQETNLNLVREMEKMNRVLKPSLKLFVGEAIAGNALAQQASEFNKAIKLDGIILTKLDCDAKGGGAFSIAYETQLPILFVGMGQEYDDLTPFDAEWLVNSVLAA